MSEPETVPAHLGFILDGNRRWAKENGLSSLEGHRKGAAVFKDISLAAFRRGVKYVSAFVFSTENWRRAEEEVNYLMKLAVQAVEDYMDEVHEEGIKVIILGRRKGVRSSVLAALDRIEERTAQNTKGTLAICFNYGGRQEIVDAARKLIAQKVDAESLTMERFEGELYHPEVPGLDLIIRTSGEQRLSGFMLYRAEYAELAFVEKNWPDFTQVDLDDILADYAGRQRRLGA